MKNKNIVLLHGWGVETKKLGLLKEELENLGWQVMLPKLAGFDNPPPKTVWGIKDYSDYVLEEVGKKFGENKYIVFGHSFGGGIAIKLGVSDSKNIKGVVLCATRGISRTKSIKRLIFTSLAKTGKVFLLTPAIADKFKKLLYKAAREHDYEKTQGIMREVFKKVIGEDLKPYIAEIKVPVLVLWGMEDRMTPVRDAYFIKSKLPESKLVVFENQGHKLPYEKPKDLAKEIDIWSTHQ